MISVSIYSFISLHAESKCETYTISFNYITN